MCHAVPAFCLTRHMRVHSEERPSECTECGLCLFVLLLLKDAIVVYRAIAVVFEVYIMIPFV